MSGYADEFNDLAAAFTERWEDRLLLAYPNSSFTYSKPAKPWCRFNVLNAPPVRMTIGAPDSNRVIYPGRVVIQFFAPRGSGEIDVRRHADEAAEIFRAMKLPGYRFFPPSVAVVAAKMDDDWYQANMDCPFQRDVYNG